METGMMPNRITLYRRPILDYWAENEETLGDIITHVLIHEIGHHFGLSDDDMERIEASAEEAASQSGDLGIQLLLMEYLCSPARKGGSGTTRWPMTTPMTSIQGGSHHEITSRPGCHHHRRFFGHRACDARLFAEQGAALVLNARGLDALDSAAAKIRQAGGTVVTVAGDVAPGRDP